MAYQSLYRRYRPQRFSEVRGQEHLVRALRNAVVEGRVGHAYLFSGPRGTGKTSTARILAKVLNCEHPVDGEPDGTCASCLAIEHGTSFDVFELDAASNNGVDAIRSLIERAQLGSPGRTKVYILDEVHMLSAAASNALLKTLEEPPEHVVFVLATTDPQKVLPTIKSRTQHFEVHLLPAEELRKLAEFIVADAGLDVGPEAIDYVVRAGAGSARDMESALDQVAAAGGAPDDVSALDELVEAICERDTGRAFVAVEQAMGSGSSPRLLGENLIARLRDVFLAAVRADLSRLTEADRSRATDQAARLGAAGATRALEVLGDAFVGIADAPDPRVSLEVALVRLTKPEADHSLAAIVERLEHLERGLGPIGAPPPPAPHTEVHPHVDRSAPTAAAATEPGPDEPAPDGGAAAGGQAPGGPAAAARQQLAARRARGGEAAKASRPAAPAPAPGPRPTRAPAPKPTPATSGTPSAPTAPSTEDAPASPPAAPVPAASAGATGGGPSRDALTLAWGDTILGSLTPKAKSRFAGGRFLDVDAAGTARFALPNAHHASRCEEVRAEVEQALGAHFGVPVPLAIVVDDEPVAPATGRSSVPPGDADELVEVDLAELVDADDAAVTSIDRIAEVFPGLEVVEGE
jgi:DNA polymerase-3 subunit gamma/tau